MTGGAGNGVQTRAQAKASPQPRQPSPDHEVLKREQPPPRSLLSRLSHWGPMLAILVISEISVATLNSHLAWWHPAEGVFAAVNLGTFLIWAFLTVSNLFAAASIGPHYVPFGWTPEKKEDHKRVQYCEVCKSYKAPRSHHCRKCQRCVCKMDHHCPWINNCVGFSNQPYFMKFLAFAVIGCTHSLFILGPAVYRAVFRVPPPPFLSGLQAKWFRIQRWHEYYGIPPVVDLGIYGLLFAILAFGLAVGVSLSVGFLLYVQLASVCRNRTGIEDYILRKSAAIRKRKGTTFAYPYAIGWRQSLRETLTWDGRPKGDGIYWSLAPGATQFTLSKAIKRRNAVEYVAVRDFSGRVLTVSHGCRTFCCTPWSDEPRIRLAPGDRILVTRWAKAWLYGEKMEDGGGEGKAAKRGWFPECVVRNVDQMETDSEEEEVHEEDAKTK